MGLRFQRRVKLAFIIVLAIVIAVIASNGH
jgi:hypothetical protein